MVEQGVQGAAIFVGQAVEWQGDSESKEGRDRRCGSRLLGFVWRRHV